ncbi:YchJ family protein [Marinobacterium weihaiense]|uniref:YchJ family protein n=1 Tax=Marinobacterium weihaiense TaxID=2851016 RepID=A0ABS6M955_9GAMM|nr:YchJ family protein [Marinobacterium weihaiense]MBV0932715.1 YchJ family protein [Marinobacterium weihaiense]
MPIDTQDMDTRCPCGSGKPFSFCCEPAISGRKPAATAEALMRSRYTAFVLGAVDYLINTTAARKRSPLDAELLSEQTQVTTWTGLEIIDTEAGSALDQQGVVEFKASFDSPEGSAILHERSRFEREQGLWVYTDGDVELLHT